MAQTEIPPVYRLHFQFHHDIFTGLKCQDFKLKGLQFHFIKQLKNGHPNLRPCHFEASEDTMTKSKSQAVHVIRIKSWKAGGSGNLPSLFLPSGTSAFYFINSHPDQTFWQSVYYFSNLDICSHLLFSLL